MVIGGVSPMLGVVVLLILTGAALFALNRRAVAARPASTRARDDLFEPRFRSPTAPAATWPSGDWTPAREWTWEDGSPGGDIEAETAPSGPAPASEPIGRTAARAASADPEPGAAKMDTGLADPVALAVDTMLEQGAKLGPQELARLDVYRAERILAYADSVGGTLKGRRDESKLEQLAAVRRYAEGKLGEVEIDGEEPVEDHDRDTDAAQGSPAADANRPPLALVPPPIEAPTVAWDEAPEPQSLPLPPPGLMPADPAFTVAASTNDEAPGETSVTAAERDLDPVAFRLEPAARDDAVEILSPGRGEWDPVPETLDPFWCPPTEGGSFPAQTVSEPPGEPPTTESPWWDEGRATEARPDLAGEIWPDCLVVDPFTEIATRSSTEDVPVPEDVVVEAAPSLDASTLQPPALAAPEPDAGLADAGLADADTLLEAYRAAESAEAKCRAIDALAEQASDPALAALQVCLDDADPTVQLHALEAAERLLSR